MLALQTGAGNAAVARLVAAQQTQVSRFGIGDVFEAATDAIHAGAGIFRALVPHISLTGSVGSGGKNAPADVEVVRQRLVLLGFAPETAPAPAPSDGTADEHDLKALAAAIERFQSARVKLPRPDGRVDPGGRTLRALNLQADPKAKAPDTEADDETDEDTDGGQPSPAQPRATDMDADDVARYQEKAIEQASLTDEQREQTAPAMETGAEQRVVTAKLKALDEALKAKQITTKAYRAEKKDLKGQAAELNAKRGEELKGVGPTARARMEMEEELVALFPQFADRPELAVEEWFKGIRPDATFLGVPIRGSHSSTSPGIHQDLLTRLEAVENALDPEQRAAIKIHEISGLRTPKPATGGTQVSMHCFGLAIDIDPGGNPFVRKGSAEPISHVRILITGKPYDITAIPHKDVGKQWDELNSVTEDMRTYFALTAPDQIEPYLAKHPEARALGDAVWWQKRIRTDEAWLEALDTWDPGQPAKGLMNLDKVLVTALVNHGKLRWGGQYDISPQAKKRKGKDIMHFDWRGGRIGR